MNIILILSLITFKVYSYAKPIPIKYVYLNNLLPQTGLFEHLIIRIFMAANIV